MLDGKRIPKNDYYWNAGVIVFTPSVAAHTTLMDMYKSGDFPNADPGNFAADQVCGSRCLC